VRWGGEGVSPGARAAAGDPEGAARPLGPGASTTSRSPRGAGFPKNGPAGNRGGRSFPEFGPQMPPIPIICPILPVFPGRFLAGAGSVRSQ
jgi:hypothetical protein